MQSCNEPSVVISQGPPAKPSPILAFVDDGPTSTALLTPPKLLFCCLVRSWSYRAIWRLLCSSFLGVTCFLIRGYSILPKTGNYIRVSRYHIPKKEKVLSTTVWEQQSCASQGSASYHAAGRTRKPPRCGWLPVVVRSGVHRVLES